MTAARFSHHSSAPCRLGKYVYPRLTYAFNILRLRYLVGAWTIAKIGASDRNRIGISDLEGRHTNLYTTLAYENQKFDFEWAIQNSNLYWCIRRALFFPIELMAQSKCLITQASLTIITYKILYVKYFFTYQYIRIRKHTNH